MKEMKALSAAQRTVQVQGLKMEDGKPGKEERVATDCYGQVRDLYWTFRNFRNRVTDFLRYRRVTSNMDQRFQDASPEDLARRADSFLKPSSTMLLTPNDSRLHRGVPMRLGLSIDMLVVVGA